MKTNSLLSLRALANETGLSAEWLKNEALSGHIPHLKVGRRLMFSLQAVREALLRRASEECLDESGPSDGRGGAR